jgi:hypothetical protein
VAAAVAAVGGVRLSRLPGDDSDGYQFHLSCVLTLL